MTGPSSPRVVARRREGEPVCAWCHALGAVHLSNCPVPALEAEVAALAGAVGLFVADVKERLNALERLLHGGT